MNLPHDIINVISSELSNKDKLMLFMTCTDLYKFHKTTIYTDPVEFSKISHLSWKNNFKFIQVSCKSISFLDKIDTNLTKLILKRCTFHNLDIIVKLNNLFCKLTHLYIFNKCHDCDYNAVSFRKDTSTRFDDNISCIFNQCKKLTCLEMYFVPVNKSLEKLPSSLVSLNIFNNLERRLTHNGYSYYNKDKYYKIPTMISPNLEKLSLGCNIQMNLSNNKLKSLSTNFIRADGHKLSSLNKLSILSNDCKMETLTEISKINNLKKLKLFAQAYDVLYISDKVTHLVIHNYDYKNTTSSMRYCDLTCSEGSSDDDNQIYDFKNLAEKKLPYLHTIIINSFSKSKIECVYDHICIPSVHTLIIKDIVTQHLIETIPISVTKLCIYVQLNKEKIQVPDHIEIIRTYASNRPYIISKNLILYTYPKVKY